MSDAGCGATTNIFTFLVKVYDDFCPANAITIATMKITILPALTQPAPDFRCVTENSEGDITISWNHSLSANNSTSYQILGAPNLGGPYSQLVDIIYPNDSYTIDSSNVPQGVHYYYLTLNSLCASISGPSDTMVPIRYNINSSNVNCYGGDDGRIAIEMLSNLTNPFYYSLNGVLNINPVDSVFDNLTQGTYLVSLTDNMSCYIEEEIFINVPLFPLQVLTLDTITVCHQDSTAWSIAIGAGGTPGYLYNWYSGVVGPNNPTISTNDTAFNLAAGIYYVRITDANGCDTVSSVQILSPSTALFSTTQISPVVCKGDSSGFIIGDAGGGFAPYTYTWSTSLGGVIQQHPGLSNTDTLYNMPADVYLLDIIDHRGCTASQTSITINEPLDALKVDTIVLVDSIDCFGDNSGRAIAYYSGGDSSYSYLWDSGENTLLAEHLTSGYHTFGVTDGRGCEVSDSIFIPESPEIISTLVIDSTINCYGSTNGIVSVSTVGGYPLYIYSWSNNQPLDTGVVDTAFYLSYGAYALTTEDSLGCSVVDSIYLTEPNLLTMEASELAWISCKDSSDGLAFSTAWGGTMPYVFSWNGNQIGDTVNTLSPGVHLVTVTDAKGCTASDTVEIHEPPYLTVSIIDIIPVYCNGMSTGSLTASASGGTPGYSYLWDDNQGLPQTTATAVNLEADIYTVTATDSRGCQAFATEDISVVVATMELDSTFTAVSCNGAMDGTASVTAFGGHTPYMYSWVGPNGVVLSSLTAISNLAAGTYSVTVTDTNNCTQNTSVDIYEPLPIMYNISTSTDELCLGACNGQIFIDSITGGTLPYTGVVIDNFSLDTTYLPMTTDSIIPNVCSGDYTVGLTDINGCDGIVIPSGNDQAIVTSINSQLPAPQINITDNIDCYGDNTGMIVLVGSPNVNYIYTWYNINGNSVGIGNSANTLSAGDYYVMAQFQTSNGSVITTCSITSGILTITQPSEITLDTSIVHVDCNSGSTGSLTALASGGTPGSGYSYLWSNGATTASISGLSAGMYGYTVEDANGCESTLQNISVNEPDALTVDISRTSSSPCAIGYYELKVDLPSTGGTLPYSYSWIRDLSGTQINVGVGSTYTVYDYGTYHVLITDVNGCSSESNGIDFIESWNCDPVDGCIDPCNGSGTYTGATALTDCQAICATTVINEVGLSGISIYPNPFKEETTVDFGRVLKDVELRIFDVLGKLLAEHDLKDVDKFIIEREDKVNGIYFIEVEIEGINWFNKIILE